MFGKRWRSGNGCHGRFCGSDDGLSSTPDDYPTDGPGSVMTHDDMFVPPIPEYLKDVFSDFGGVSWTRHLKIRHDLGIVRNARLFKNLFRTVQNGFCRFSLVIRDMDDEYTLDVAS